MGNYCFSQEGEDKADIAGGFSVFIPVSEAYYAKIDPTTPSDFYSKVENRFSKGKEYRGLFIAPGVSVPLSENRNVEFRLSFSSNSFFYDSPVPGSGTIYEVRTLKFKIVEFSLGVNIL
jgi:hypothetical protein